MTDRENLKGLPIVLVKTSVKKCPMLKKITAFRECRVTRYPSKETKTS
jgi:hypothetical protein